jgi:sugar phosphate isomerase/epimerase
MSNIAWSPAFDQEVAEILRDNGLSGVEIAPTRIWPHPLEADPRQANAYRRDWERRGFPIVALQALLFGQDHLRLFEMGAKGRAEMLAYLEGIIELGARLGAQALVFGSPKARRREELGVEEARRIAADFFRDVGEAAARHDLCLCIEANPPDYGADFVLNAKEATDLVAAVDHQGFRLHLDTACMHLAGDDPAVAISTGAPVLRHFHVSEPNLAPVGESSSDVDHERGADALRACDYNGYVSVEMRAVPEDGQLHSIQTAASFVRRVYGE